MPARTTPGPRRTVLAVEQLETRDVPSVSVSVVVPGGHHGHYAYYRPHPRIGVSVQVHVGSFVGVDVSVGSVGVHVSV